MTRRIPTRPALLAATAAALILQLTGGALARARAADDHDEDRAAIRSAMQSFKAAFEARDAAALAAHWTAEGEYRNEDGMTVQGREALERAFAAFFEATPELSAESRPGSLRFLAADLAILEGTVTVRRGPAEAATEAAFSALFLREEGRWLLAELHESPGDGPTVADLDWLIGDWETAAGQGATIRTSYTWAPGETFLQARFAIEEDEAALALSGTQVIGIDPATGTLHGWTFGADGGIAEADWFPDGDHWVLEAAGTLADGRTLTETNILRRVDYDTFTWQSVDRLLDDAPLPDLPPVKVTRVKAAAESE